MKKPKIQSPIRYYMETRPITLWESVRRLWQTWKWNRNEIYMRPVKKGEIGYDEAPFELSVMENPMVYVKDE